MPYHPRHALARAVRALSPKARAAIVVGSAIAATAGGLAVAGTSGAATPAYSVGAHNISMGRQFAGLCLDDYKRNTSANAPVVIWSCSGSDPAQQWYMAGDGTVRLGGPAGPALGVNNGKVVMSTTDDHWQPLGDWGVVNTDLSTAQGGDNGPEFYTLNDPAYGGQGTQQIAYLRSLMLPANAQYNMPSTSYAKTTYTDRPDSGNGSVTVWALDDATRYASVTSIGGDNYEGSVADDNGTFLKVPNANDAPNGSGSILAVGKGYLSGTSGYTFTADKSPSSSNVPGSMFGGEPGITACWASQCPNSLWYQLFFPSGTTFGGSGIDSGTTDPMGWAWLYLTQCGASNSWANTAANGGGKGAADGNIIGC